MAINRLRRSQVAKTRGSRILLDASFILRIVEKPLKAFDRIEEALGRTEFIVVDDVVKELKALASSRSGRKQRIALQGLRYAEQLPRLGHVHGGLTVDGMIVECARSKGVAVATLDAELRRKLRRVGVTVVSCRGEEVVVDGGAVIPKDS